MQRPIYLVFGPQGSGKSTQAELLAHSLRLPYFDAGNALRQLVESGRAEGKIAQEKMQTGQLVPNSILKTLFTEFIDEHDCSKGLVADGFPRNLTQTEVLNDLAAEHNWQVIGIYIHITDETAKSRLANRTVTVNGQVTTREDDQPAIVEKRLATFRAETLPVVEWLKDKHALYSIDGQPTVEHVSASIKQQLGLNG